MKKLFKNGTVVNVFTGELEKKDVLVDDGVIIGVDQYEADDDTVVYDVSGKFLSPGFIDAHIHIESAMLTPSEFAKVCVPRGTTAVVTDPHEIANVCGKEGIRYMLEASEGLPLDVFVMIPSCVPATGFDQSGAVLEAEDIEEFYSHERVLGLAEVMNYVGVIAQDPLLMKKIKSAKEKGKVLNGHAPLLSGQALDKYISAGIGDDHECSNTEEAKEKIRKGQRVFLRYGSSAKNLDSMLELFDEPWASKCMLVTDDKHPSDLLDSGHIDAIIRRISELGKNVIKAIQMASIQCAEYYGLRGMGAIAPGYNADIVILDDLSTVKVSSVYKKGKLVAENGNTLDYEEPVISKELEARVRDSFNMPDINEPELTIDCSGKKKCRVINIVKGQLITTESIEEIDFSVNNGISVEKDILKIAVCERHNNTGNLGVGFIKGIGMKRGAMASSVSHDSHNLIIIGTNASDMEKACDVVRENGGGSVTVCDGKIIKSMPLPIAGLMTDMPVQVIAKQNEELINSVYELGVPNDITPFMTMAFVSLPVIPHIKMTTYGLVDVNDQKLISLFVEE